MFPCLVKASHFHFQAFRSTFVSTGRWSPDHTDTLRRIFIILGLRMCVHRGEGLCQCRLRWRSIIKNHLVRFLVVFSWAFVWGFTFCDSCPENKPNIKNEYVLYATNKKRLKINNEGKANTESLCGLVSMRQQIEKKITPQSDVDYFHIMIFL